MIGKYRKCSFLSLQNEVLGVGRSEMKALYIDLTCDSVSAILIDEKQTKVCNLLLLKLLNTSFEITLHVFLEIWIKLGVKLSVLRGKILVASQITINLIDPIKHEKQ